MAAFLNKVILMGNLTREPELRYTPGNNSAICEFGLAINRRYIQNGQEKEEACFVDIVVWGKQAESCSRFLQKGASVLVEGRLVYDSWTEKDTQKKRSRLRVNADRVQFMSSRREDGGMNQSVEMGEDPTAQYDSPRPQYSRPAPQQQGRYTRQQYGAPQQQPAMQQNTGYYDDGQNNTAWQQPASAPQPPPPPMPESDPLEDVDDIPF